MFNLIAIMVTLFTNATLTVTSSSFGQGGMIPSKFTCEGENSSPALHIQGIPANAKSLAIILNDPDAPMKGGFTHWVAFNIDPAADIPEKFNGGVEAMNGAGKAGYIGPCPPTGTHHYHFMVYALDAKLDLAKSANKEQLEKAIEGHVLAQGELIGLYKKVK
jgi:Raf kinase inhibitor-like YbhB/YbcL family protein